MSQAVSVWLVALVGLLAANLQFASNRLFAVLALKAPKKLAMRLEQRAGQIAPKGWGFYAITGALFSTFAFSRFAYRYRFKHRL